MTYGTAKRTNERTRAMNRAMAEMVDLAADRYGMERSGPQNDADWTAMTAEQRAAEDARWDASDARVAAAARRHGERLGGEAVGKIWVQAQAAVRKP